MKYTLMQLKKLAKPVNGGKRKQVIMENTYTIIVHRKNQEDLVRTGVDKLNACIIPAELELAFPEAFEKGYMSVEVIKEQ